MSTPPQGAGGQAAGDNRPMRIPLVTNLRNRSESYKIDGRMVNAYAEVVGQGEAHIYKRPCLVPYSQPPGGPAGGLGVFNWNGIVYSIFGNTFYSGTTPIGTVSTNAPYTFSSIQGAQPSLFFQNGTSYYFYNPVNSLVPITPGSFTTSVPGCVYLDGTMYVMDSGANIRGSDINNVATGHWNAANLIVAQSEPCPAVALFKQLVYVVAFKTFSTEMFYDAGNATDSPLGAVPGQKLNYGCRDARTIAELAGVLLWVDQIREGGSSVRIMDQVTAQPCSTPQVERLLQYADAQGYYGGNLYTWTAKIDGHLFYCLTIQNLNVTLVYDISQKLWYEWTDPAGNYMPIISSTFLNGQTICQGQSDGRLYQLSTQVGADNGVTVPVDVYTPEFDGGTHRRKVIDRMRVVGDYYPGNVLQIRVSDDNYTTWSNFRTVDMGMVDPYLVNCGTFRRRVWHIHQESAVGGRLMQALEPELELGDA
jgi:hypothetical protein